MIIDHNIITCDYFEWRESAIYYYGGDTARRSTVVMHKTVFIPWVWRDVINNF